MNHIWTQISYCSSHEAHLKNQRVAFVKKEKSAMKLQKVIFQKSQKLLAENLHERPRIQFQRRGHVTAVLAIVPPPPSPTQYYLGYAYARSLPLKAPPYLRNAKISEPTFRGIFAGFSCLADPPESGTLLNVPPISGELSFQPPISGQTPPPPLISGKLSLQYLRRSFFMFKMGSQNSMQS